MEADMYRESLWPIFTYIQLICEFIANYYSLNASILI